MIQRKGAATPLGERRFHGDLAPRRLCDATLDRGLARFARSHVMHEGENKDVDAVRRKGNVNGRRKEKPSPRGEEGSARRKGALWRSPYLPVPCLSFLSGVF